MTHDTRPAAPRTVASLAFACAVALAVPALGQPAKPAPSAPSAPSAPPPEQALPAPPPAPAPSSPAPSPGAQAQVTRADVLRGAYGPFRANNDLLSYDLDVRVDPSRKFISGVNRIRFRMLEDASRIQIDLFANLDVDRILFKSKPLAYEREINAVFVDFPQPLRRGRTYEIAFHYSGHPAEAGRFGGITFRKDPAGRDWVNTSCQHVGASVWWPNKDQYRDEVEHMRLRVAAPNGLMDVSNGRFEGKTDLGDGYTRWDWRIHYPINSYNVSLNVGRYEHFTDAVDGQRLDFYCLPEHLGKARAQFAQARTMMQAFQEAVAPYPFPKDGYKLVEAPYSGMEHQSAVTYGNRFANGYLERDWTGVGISTKFDFIIVHESAHEWFGNSVTADDSCHEWIHEAWGTYLEGVYVEHLWGKADALKYLNGYQSKVRNRDPIVPPCGLSRTPPQDMYFKGALFLHTLRSVVDDDTRWAGLVRGFYDRFKYRNISTDDVVRFFNERTGMALTPIFEQYLRHAALPVLELRFDETKGAVAYRWKADAAGFDMPVKAGLREAWTTLRPTAAWQTMPWGAAPEAFEVATDLYFVSVEKKGPGPFSD